ncbi:MAG: endonuclease/exonuclease/phosphatase family protein [Acidobacteriota bacterium]|nr:endonuclease/exonuclease/phosphatase family protein [Acidobacteriota bacterium]
MLLTLPIQAGSKAELFSFTELVTLYEREALPEPLGIKLNHLLTTPFVENSNPKNTPFNFSQSPRLGEFLRVACWNIERGIEYEALEAAFAGAEEFEALLDAEEFPPGSEARRKILEQAAALKAADVIVLNEADWGMKRTEYRHVAAELAARLGMNYAFGVQFIELSPVHLSVEPARQNAEENEVLNLIKVEPERYKGLHGVAILSRFPLENVRLVPFKNQPYDWYKSEKNGTSILEKGKRQLSKRIFLEETLREVRRGGRTTLLVEIVDRRFPGGRVTIAATHLENRTKPANRVKQLEELLATIKEIRHPVILAGDMNTSTEDLTPTSVKRELMKRFGNPKFWLRRGINYALGFGFMEDFLLGAVSFARSHADPTVKHVPFFMRNPERKFFTTLQDYRFADGGAFDFRGDAGRSVGDKTKRLANSNERRSKGFATTFRVKRPIKFIGKYKLDWIFVKPASLTNPTDRNQSYRFAPHFGRTLDAINDAIEDGISDHRPLIVDLPLGDPPRPKKDN